MKAKTYFVIVSLLIIIGNLPTAHAAKPDSSFFNTSIVPYFNVDSEKTQVMGMLAWGMYEMDMLALSRDDRKRNKLRKKIQKFTVKKFLKTIRKKGYIVQGWEYDKSFGNGGAWLCQILTTKSKNEIIMRIYQNHRGQAELCTIKIINKRQLLTTDIVQQFYVEAFLKYYD